MPKIYPNSLGHDKINLDVGYLAVAVGVIEKRQVTGKKLQVNMTRGTLHMAHDA